MDFGIGSFLPDGFRGMRICECGMRIYKCGMRICDCGFMVFLVTEYKNNDPYSTLV